MRSRSEVEKEQVDMNNAPVARFGGRRDTEYSFGDLEEQVPLAHELAEKDLFGSRSDTSDAGTCARSEGLFECSSGCSKEEKVGFANDATVAHFGGQFDTTFSFGDPEEQAHYADAGAIREFGNRVELGEQSSRPWESLAKAGVESRDDAVSVGAGIDRQFSFGNPVEQAVWPSELAVIGQVACVQGSVLGSVLCGSGARAARKFRQRAAENDCSNLSALRVQSTEPHPRMNAEYSAALVDAQLRRSVKPDPRIRTELTADVQRRRSVKPEPRARPCASSTRCNSMMACVRVRRSVKPTPRHRPIDRSNQRIEAANSAGWAEGAPTGDVTLEMEAADEVPSLGTTDQRAS